MSIPTDAGHLLLDGRKIADELKLEIKREVEGFVSTGARPPHLAAILVGNDGGSLSYVGHKVKDCQEVGFASTLLHFEDTSVEESALLAEVRRLNSDQTVDGFIVQLPLPAHIAAEKITLAIDPSKDVDGFHPFNVGKVALGMPAFVSATPLGIIKLLERYHIETAGRHCVVLGRSNIVGRPVSILLGSLAPYGNATVTLCHSRTVNLKELTLQADILVVALGRPGFLTADMVKPGAVVIDVGTTRVPDSSTKSGFRLKGDADFENMLNKVSAITPVPGGVGPMTRVSLLLNTLQAYKEGRANKAEKNVPTHS